MNNVQNILYSGSDNESDTESDNENDIESDSKNDTESDNENDTESGNKDDTESDNGNDVNGTSDIDDEPDDSSLRDIYTGQTFTTFEILEACLKRYANKTGFEIKVTRSEREDGKWSRKTYKCHHGGEYEPKKNVDLHIIETKNQLVLDVNSL